MRANDTAEGAAMGTDTGSFPMAMVTLLSSPKAIVVRGPFPTLGNPFHFDF